MSIYYVSSIHGSDSNTGLTSWTNAKATVQSVISGGGIAHGDHIWLASGESFIRWNSSNVQFHYASVNYGDTPSTSDVEDCTYIPSDLARIYTDSNALFAENSARVKFHWIDFDGVGWTVPQLISSYGSYPYSEIWAFDCKFRNGVIGIRKSATYPGFIKTERCEFTSISGAGIYASQCQVESDNDLFHDLSGIGVHLLNSNGGHASYVKKGTFYRLTGTSYDGVRIDGRAAGDTTLIQQCTFDGMVNTAVNNTPSNLSTTTVDSCIITDSKYPTVNSGGTLNYLYCDFYDNDNDPAGTDTGPASTTITVDPSYVNADTSDFELQATSPCIDTGNPTLTPDDNMGSLGTGAASSIEASIRTFILADVTISNIIGTRMWSIDQPQDPTLASIIYERDDTINNYTTSGNSGLVTPSFVFYCWADDITQARVLAKALKDRIDGYKGTMGDHYISAVFEDNCQDRYDSNLKKHYVQADYKIWFDET